MSSQCPLCSIDCESIAHAFFKCARVKEIWDRFGMLQIINDASVEEINGTPILESLLMNSANTTLLPEVRHCDLAAVAIWYIW